MAAGVPEKLGPEGEGTISLAARCMAGLPRPSGPGLRVPCPRPGPGLLLNDWERLVFRLGRTQRSSESPDASTCSPASVPAVASGAGE